MNLSPDDLAKMYAACLVKRENKIELGNICQKMMFYKPRYQTVGDKIGVPWDVVAAIHYRESNLNFSRYLQNGDPLFDSNGTPVKTVHVPIGQGPYKTWEESAIAALSGTYPPRPNTWCIGTRLDFCERYNGLGDRMQHRMSPYIWSYTNLYSIGKYDDDHEYNPTLIDQQAGCAAIFKTLGI